MEIYNPKGFNLPPIKIGKRKYRINIEQDQTVKNFINTKLLLDNDFNKLYSNILKKSKEVISYFNIIDVVEDDLFRNLFFHFTKTNLSRSDNYKKFLIIQRKLRHPSRIKDEEAKKELILEAIKDNCKEIKKRLKNMNRQIENSISHFEREKGIDLNILSSSSVYFCKKCNKILSINKFKQQKCICGEQIARVSQMEQIPIHHFNQNMINFLEYNYWLEFAFDYILKRKKLITLIGQEVLGNSGVCHEIDNIAYCPNENFRFFCECKNSEVKESDIFIFSGKMIDIGGTRGYIFTTSKNVSDEIKRLARSKNIDIVVNVLNKDLDILIKDIKE